MKQPMRGILNSLAALFFATDLLMLGGGLLLFGLTNLALVSVTVAILTYLRRAETVPLEEQVPYANVPRTSPAVAALDPRAPASPDEIR